MTSFKLGSAQDAPAWQAARVSARVTAQAVAIPREALRRSGGLHIAGSPLSDDIGYSVRSFTARSRRQRATLDAAFRLRARVLVHELGWLLPNTDDLECDRCDTMATHFAVMASAAGEHMPRLAGYARVLLPRHGFMLAREFADLLDGSAPIFDAARAFEVSRVVVDPRFRRQRCRDGRTVTEHLGRAIATWALARGRTECYTVCETRHLRALRLRGLRFDPFGCAVEYQRGVQVSAAMLRLAPTVVEWRECRPDDLAWYLASRQNVEGVS